jgi:crotonobetainyl-CoA:carnitine CoA-transferase CaiB-like acyl-CoA transferase
MADVLLSFSQVVIGEALTEEAPKPGETVLTGQYPCYDIYETADGQYVTLAAIEPQFWQTFCEVIERSDLTDDHFTANEDTRAQVRNAVTQVSKERSRERWEELLSDVPFVAINTVAQVVEDKSFEHRGMIRRSGGTPRIGFPVQSSNRIPAGEDSVPKLREHSDEVLHQVGYTGTRISKLRESGVI